MQTKHTGRTLPGLKAKPLDIVDTPAQRLRAETQRAVETVRRLLLAELAKMPRTMWPAA